MATEREKRSAQTMAGLNEVVCHLCDGLSSRKDMVKYKGNWYHKVKIKPHTDSCVDAVKARG